MKFAVCSVRDVVAGVYMQPFLSRSTPEAIRQIRQSMSDPQILQTPVGQSPKDFTLHRVADFDDESGSMAPCEPEYLGNLADFVPSTVPS